MLYLTKRYLLMCRKTYFLVGKSIFDEYWPPTPKANTSNIMPTMKQWVNVWRIILIITISNSFANYIVSFNIFSFNGAGWGLRICFDFYKNLPITEANVIEYHVKCKGNIWWNTKVQISLTASFHTCINLLLFNL